MIIQLDLFGEEERDKIIPIDRIKEKKEPERLQKIAKVVVISDYTRRPKPITDKEIFRSGQMAAANDKSFE